jgi:UDP-2-acetamido-3-amino-2,3-dideoxy-glucuronate N-acetyltransferase
MKDVFVHPQGIVESPNIGPGTRVWAFAHILPGASVGRDCNICDNVFIENDVIIGDRVTIKCGVQLWDGLRVERDVFIGPNATFTNDRHPRSKHPLAKYPETWVREGASIGANATVLPGLTIGRRAMVGAGSVVTRSVPPYAVVVGNPARIVRYIDTEQGAVPGGATAVASNFERVVVEGVKLLRVPLIKDLRGNLTAREVNNGLPFVPKRAFAVFDVPSKEVRGEHAHRRCEQLLVCLRGSVNAVCDDGTSRQEFLLDTPELGLYIPALVWGTQYRYSADAILLVFASDPYDPDDYLRDYDSFLNERRRGCS